MKFSITSLLVVALAAEGTLASTWFGKAVYNKWHETELERWLSDHNIPYPTPADRKDLEDAIKKNWDQKVVTPYNEWDLPQLQSYAKTKGYQAKSTAAANKDSLVKEIKAKWTDTADSTAESFASVRDWIFDSWSESQLKAFADKHGIPVPQPRKRDTLLKTVRENYQTAADKIKETAAYPGDWIYNAWSESDLKEWLDERGIPNPQPTSRDKLIASVRRNSRLAGLQAQSLAAAASSSAAAAQASLSEEIINAWSDSQIKEWADKNGIKVPQGSKRNELLALARKHRASLLGDTVASTASSAFGAATTKAGNAYAAATDAAAQSAQDAFDAAIATWSDSRLKAYLDARGVPVPQNGKKDELVAAVRLQAHKASTGYSAWTFDTWTTENLKKWLATQNNKLAKKSGVTRDELVKQAQDSYASASKSGGTAYASVTSYLAQQTDAAKETTFDTWSDSDLKHYLDSYGVPVYQGTTSNELKALARRQYNYFYYGTSTPQGTLFAKVQEYANWAIDQVKAGVAGGRKEAEYQGQKVADAAGEAASTAKHRASEAAQRATDKVKEEL